MRAWMSSYGIRQSDQLSLGHGSVRPPSPKPWHQAFMEMSLLGTSRAGKQLKRGCSSPCSCLDDRQGLEPDFTLSSRYSSPLIMAFADLVKFLIRS